MPKQNKIQVLAGTPFVYKPLELDSCILTTFMVTGTGTCTVKVHHLNNTVMEVISAEQAPFVQSVYGVGFEQITFINDGANTVFVSVTSIRG